MKRMKRILRCTLSLLLVLVLVAPQQALAAIEIPVTPGVYTYGYTQKGGRWIEPDKVENGTLIIGTHLIHMSAMTNKVYRMAEASAAEFNQPNIYFKSDLADGTWFEISSAAGVADITTKGSPVDKKKIATLRGDYWTKSDGLTYRLYGAERHSMYLGVPFFDFVTYIFPERDVYINPYTYTEVYSPLEAYVEMKSFDVQYQLFKDQESDYCAWDKDYINYWVNEFNKVYNFSFAVDRDLEYYEKMRIEMLKTGMTSMEKEVMSWFMDDLERQRIVRRMELIVTYLERLANDLERFSNKPGKKASYDFNQSIREAQMNLRSTCASLNSQMIARGETFLEQERCDEYQKLRSSTTVTYARSKIESLVHIENIINGNIVNPNEEKLIIVRLERAALNEYGEALFAGASSDYKAAVDDKAAPALLNSLISQQNGELNRAKNEYESLYLEDIKRTGPADAIGAIKSSIDKASRYYNTIPNDAFKEIAVANVDAHIEFLRNLLKSLTGEESPEEELQKEKLRLQDSLMEVLDENKTDEADEIRKKIDEVDKEIAAVEADNAAEVAALEEKIEKIEGEIKEADKEEAEKLAEELGEAKKKLADVKDGSDDSIIKVVEDLKKDAKDAVDSGDAGGVDIIIDILIPIAKDDPIIVVPAIKDIHDKMVDEDGGKDFKDQIKKAEDAIRDNADAAAEASKPKKEREIELIVGEYDPQDDKRNAAVVAALGEYVYTEPGNGMEDFWKDWLDKLLADNNPYVFIRYNDGANEYIPYDVLGYFAGMRPVWYKTQNIGTLSKGGEYYSFKVDSTKVGRDKDSTKNDEMKITAKWQTVVHVHESYTKLKFDCEAFYIPNSIYGVLVSPEIKVMLDEIMGKIEDAGKPKQL